MCQSRKTAAAPSSKRTTVDFRQRGDEAEEGHQAAVPTSAAFMAGRRFQAMTVSNTGGAAHDGAGDGPLETGRVSPTAPRIGHDHEGSQACDQRPRRRRSHGARRAGA
jgi:hypothetical protein